MLSIGDKVKIKNHPDEITGVISEKNHSMTIWGAFDYKYMVTFDNEDLIPKQMEYEEDALILIDLAKRISYGCECGSMYTQYPDLHMFYCPKYRKIII